MRHWATNRPGNQYRANTNGVCLADLKAVCAKRDSLARETPRNGNSVFDGWRAPRARSANDSGRAILQFVE